ncbi:MAG TPA: sensor histidine kinase [Trebonia sp.]|nr:sensor histidine kinase [Trebonia sp.]
MTDSLAPGLPVTGGFRHIGFLYRSRAEYAQAVAGFLRDGLAAGEPAFTAVPSVKVSLIRDALGADARYVEFADMTEMGRNPAWIIPRVLKFTNGHPEQRVRYVGEPVWPSRTDAELREATRHEALINLAFAAAEADILCPYDIEGLDPAVVGDAMRTHPLMLSALSGDGYEESPGFAVPSLIPSSCSLPLPAPPPDAMSHLYRTNLSQVRALVFEHAREAGLTEARANDLVLAVSEVAANTLRHTQSYGTLDIWHDQHEIICEVHDEGTITDPLAGRRQPDPAASGGHGLWLVHQVCDLVELRSDRTGTTVRMHMTIRPSAAGR